MSAVNPRVTIRDIAEKAGLHFTTVSLALRNSPRLKERTRVKVQDLAKEMGYIPDPMLSALNAYRQTKQAVHYQATIAWVHNWPNPKNLYNCEEFNQYYLGACERARERGYVVEEFWLAEPTMNIETLHRILRARNIQGVLLAPQPVPNSYLELHYDEISAVAFGYSMQPPVLDLITNHHVHTMKTMLEKILDLGYRRIGLFIPKDWNEKVEHAWQSSLLLLHAERPDVPQIPPLWQSWNCLDPKKLRQWIDQHRLEVVISFNDALSLFAEIGFEIPEELGFASLFLGAEEKIISGMYQNDRLIGRKAVDMVVDMLHRGETGIPESPVRMLIEGVWCPGKTLRKIQAGKPALVPKKKSGSRNIRSPGRKLRG